MKYTWIIHNVCDGERFTYHTHGLNAYGSLELELNLPLVPNQAGLFINLIADSVAKGRQYHSGECVPEIFTAPFYLLETKPVHGTYEDEQVLRIIFPDENFRFPWQSGCNPDYLSQLSNIEIDRIAALLRN